MRAVDQVWMRNDTRLWFLQGDDYPRFMDLAALEDVRIGEGVGTTWVCSYCGSTVPSTDVKCTACNAPLKTRKRQASAVVSGYLPAFVWFDTVKDGFVLEVHGVRCCCPDDYTAGITLARLVDCRIIEKRIPILCPMGHADIEPLELLAYIEGDFSFTDPEREDD